MANPDQSRLLRLSDAKLIAIDVLMTGATHREAAAAAGVQRSTVTGWVHHHIGFITELAQRRQQRAQATGDLLDETITAALRLLAERIDEGDTAAAIALLRLVDTGHLHRSSHRPAPSRLATTARLTQQLEGDLMVDAMLPDRLVQIVEQNSEDLDT